MQTPLTREWSKPDVVLSLLRAARDMQSRRLIAGYFAARQSGRIGAILPSPNAADGIEMREFTRPLHVTPDSGGLATYYEIVTKKVYSPTPDWEPQPGETVVDIGGNIGVFALWAASRIGDTGRLVAAEPNPGAFDLLSANVSGFASASCHQVACGETTETLVLHFAPGRLSIGSFEERADRTNSVSVPVCLLDDLLADLDGPIDLLKIDVEGFEAQVLRGAPKTLERTGRLALEIAGSALAEAQPIVEAAGLTLTGTASGMWGIAEDHAMIAYFRRA